MPKTFLNVAVANTLCTAPMQSHYLVNRHCCQLAAWTNFSTDWMNSGYSWTKRVNEAIYQWRFTCVEAECEHFEQHFWVLIVFFFFGGGARVCVLLQNWLLFLQCIAELSQLIVQILDTLRFWAILWGIRDVRCPSWTHWKARSGLPISDNRTFSCYMLRLRRYGRK